MDKCNLPSADGGSLPGGEEFVLAIIGILSYNIEEFGGAGRRPGALLCTISFERSFS